MRVPVITVTSILNVALLRQSKIARMFHLPSYLFQDDLSGSKLYRTSLFIENDSIYLLNYIEFEVCDI